MERIGQIEEEECLLGRGGSEGRRSPTRSLTPPPPLEEGWWLDLGDGKEWKTRVEWKREAREVREKFIYIFNLSISTIHLNIIISNGFSYTMYPYAIFCLYMLNCTLYLYELLVLCSSLLYGVLNNHLNS